MSSLPLHEEGAARSLMLFPAIATAVLVVTLIPAAVLVVARRKRRRPVERPAEASPPVEEPRPTWREAYVEAVREMPSAP